MKIKIGDRVDGKVKDIKGDSVAIEFDNPNWNTPSYTQYFKLDKVYKI